MIEGVIIKKLEKYHDQRGWLAEIYRNDETEHRPAMAYISVTEPGVIRGPHEHREQTDAFVFIGPGNFELHLWDRREKSRTKGEYWHDILGEDEPTLVIVPPGVVHGYKCVSDEDGYCLNLPDRLYKGKDKNIEVDEIRWENDSDSPYQIN